MANLIGQSLGRYHILEQLGEGGMATVYKAYDTRLENDVAVKVIRTENLAPSILERSLKRFEREAKALAKLTHANIVNILDYGEYEGKPYLVMPYLPGGTLKQKLQGKPMQYQEAARLLIPIAKALSYAHQQGMVHRDVKPANILITYSGDPMLTDFGVAKIIDDEATMDLTGTSAAVGTPEYMAPEQITSKTVDYRADIYALGVVFYEMVTGRKPYTADTPMAVLFKHVSEPLPRPKQFMPSLPDSVEQILIKTLAKNPQDRYFDAMLFANALETLLTGGTNMPTDSSPAPIISAAKPKTSDTLATNFQTDDTTAKTLDEKEKEKSVTGLYSVQSPTNTISGNSFFSKWLVAGGVIIIFCVIGVVLFSVLLINKNLTLLTPSTPTSISIETLSSNTSALPASTLSPPTSTPVPTLPAPTSIPTVSVEDISGTRWYSPTDGLSVEFFNDGELEYSSPPINVSGEGGFNKNGNYKFIGNNKLQVDGVNIFNMPSSIFDVKFEGSSLLLGEKKLYRLSNDFAPLLIVDDPGYYQMYLGYWENKDMNTRGIPAINIFEDENGLLQVHVWGTCHPDWCDWGLSEAKTTDQFLYVFWDKSFARTQMILELNDQGELRLQTVTHFMDNSGRSDYSSSGEFRKTIKPTPTPGQ